MNKENIKRTVKDFPENRLERKTKSLREKVEEMPTYGDPLLERQKKEILQRCDEAEKIQAETRQMIADAMKELASYS